MTEPLSSKTVAHLREVAERLRIRGDYDNRGSDVADATACTVGADEIERMEDVGTQFAIEKGILQYDVARLRAALAGAIPFIEGFAAGGESGFSRQRKAIEWLHIAREALRGEGSRDG